jgi:YesN/AraC family two-component response regulator
MTIKKLKESTQSLSLLYVEDNKSLSQVKLEIFQEMFAKVVYAEDGYEGLKAYQEEHFDLVITDINMPNMDGIQMIEKIRKTDANQAVMVLSAYGEYEYLSRLNELNITSFLTKPVETKKLISEIGKSIQRDKESV